MTLILTWIQGYFIVIGVAYVIRLMYAITVYATHDWTIRRWWRRRTIIRKDNHGRS